MAITNNMGIWGADSDYGNWASSVRPDTNGRIAGFVGDRFVYANQVNYALKCSSLLPYVFSSILESSSISSSYNFDINPADINNSNISTFKTHMTNAINSYIASIKVVNATNADNATNATKATQDESANNIKASYGASLTGNNSAVISLINKNGGSLSTITVNYVANATYATYATRLGTSTTGSATKPVYIGSGYATECSTYAGGTAVTLNGTNKGANTASFYAPTSSGTAGQVLVSGGSGTAPSWANPPKTLYKHQISISPDSALNGSIKMEIIDNKPTSYDITSLKTYVASQTDGVVGNPSIYPPARGWCKVSDTTSDKFPVVGVYYNTNTEKLYAVMFSGSDYIYSLLEITQVGTTQKITQLT